MTNKRAVVMGAILLVLAGRIRPADAQNYGDALSGTWRNVLGLQRADGEYRWSGYPVDNFGLLTFYDPKDKKKWTDAERICATWTCLEVPYDKIPSDPDQRIRLMGFADAGQGGAVNLTDERKKELGLQVVLGNLLKMVGISGGLDWSRGVKTELTVGKIYRRSIDRDRVRQFIENKSTNQTLKRAYTNGRLSYVAADIVADSFEVTVNVDRKLNAKVDAALTKATDAVKETVAKGAPAEGAAAGAASGSATSTATKEPAKPAADKPAAGGEKAASPGVSFSFTSNGKGEYKLSVKNPVVLAVQGRNQPGAGVLADKPSPETVAPPPIPAFVGFYPAPRSGSR